MGRMPNSGHPCAIMTEAVRAGHSARLPEQQIEPDNFVVLETLRLPKNIPARPCPGPACWWRRPCPSSTPQPTASAPSQVTAGSATRPPAVPTPNAVGSMASTRSNAYQVSFTTKPCRHEPYPRHVRLPQLPQQLRQRIDGGDRIDVGPGNQHLRRTGTPRVTHTRYDLTLLNQTCPACSGRWQVQTNINETVSFPHPIVTLPQQTRVPSVRIPQVYEPSALTATKVPAGESVCPQWLLPQQARVPSVRTPQV